MKHFRRFFAGPLKQSASQAVTPLGDTPWTPTHRHKKGGLYRLIKKGVYEPDRSPVAIYDDAEGTTWVRPLAEFEDGRFTRL